MGAPESPGCGMQGVVTAGSRCHTCNGGEGGGWPAWSRTTGLLGACPELLEGAAAGLHSLSGYLMAAGAPAPTSGWRRTPLPMPPLHASTLPPPRPAMPCSLGDT